LREPSPWIDNLLMAWDVLSETVFILSNLSQAVGSVPALWEEDPLPRIDETILSSNIINAGLREL